MAKILILEDADDYTTRLASGLEQLNYRPIVALDTNDALRIIRDAPLDDPISLVVIDVMPIRDHENDEVDVSCLEILQKLRRSTEAPIVVVSAHRGADPEVLNAGADLAIRRPQNTESLQDIIDSTLIKREMVATKSTCFISYSSADTRFAEKLNSDLQRAGVKCWFAPRDLPVGAMTRDAIHKAIEGHDKLLIILSAASIRSQWVRDEVEKALAIERAQNRLLLFPISLDKKVQEIQHGWPATIANTRNIADFSEWESSEKAYCEALQHVLSSLEKA
jgi:DNA-binding response OmpR family regulator